ncbi:hypothetical protein, partial [Enterovibrio norvegicus]|uniref:hypothetical protein n=1 Tax=Enterovibrio norvegicus TaxID=188144 RepID=UPI001E2BA5C4
QLLIRRKHNTQETLAKVEVTPKPLRSGTSCAAPNIDFHFDESKYAEMHATMVPIIAIKNCVPWWWNW